MSKTIYTFLIFISILILLIILYQTDYRSIPKIHSKQTLSFSLLFLFAGFLGQAFSWKKTLKYSNCKITFKDSLISIGLTIFGKYIPGKLWIIVGRSAYISTKTKYDLSKLTIISINAQLITLWTGLGIGITGIIAQKDFTHLGLLGIMFFLILTLIIFSSFLHKILLRIIHIVFKKNIMLTPMPFQEVFSLLPWYLLYWILWTTGFYLMVASFIPSHIDGWIAIGFPLASTMGIIAVFAPGGLGIREGVLVGYMVLCGLTLKEAIVISVVARLWFVVGEIAIFLISLLLHYGNMKNEKAKLT